jgi:radical SAM protein (TIGR01212 family)
VTSWHGKSYNFFGDYLNKKYGCKILKLPVNAGFGCPNRDGTLGSGGCIFCSDEGSAAPTAVKSENILEQMKSAESSFARKFDHVHYIAYFQAFTNTYAPIPELKCAFDTALSYPGVSGLMIGTRPDCVPDDVLDLIASYKKENFELWLELGMQTMHEKSLTFIKRGHTHEQTRIAITEAARRGIPVCAHIILGIPGESWADMMATAAELSSLPVAGVKIHHLHIIKGTGLASFYRQKPFEMITMREYISILCDFIERLRPDIIVHRIAGDRDADSLIAPKWGMQKGTVQMSLDEEFIRRGSWQGLLVQ